MFAKSRYATLKQGNETGRQGAFARAAESPKGSRGPEWLWSSGFGGVRRVRGAVSGGRAAWEEGRWGGREGLGLGRAPGDGSGGGRCFFFIWFGHT